MSRWMMPRLEKWMHGCKAGPCVACSLKVGIKIRKKNSGILAFFGGSMTTYDSPSSNSRAGWALCWTCYDTECTQKRFLFGTGNIFLTAYAKAMYSCGFLDGAGNCKLLFDFHTLQWLRVRIQKMFKGHREIKTKSQLYCSRNVGIERKDMVKLIGVFCCSDLGRGNTSQVWAVNVKAAVKWATLKV